MKSQRRVSWRYLAAFAALALAVTAAMFFKPQVITLVIDPFTRLTWLVTNIVWMVDQEIYWTALIFVILAFGARLLPPRPSSRLPLSYLSGGAAEDRIAEWDKLIRRAREDEAGRTALMHALQELQRLARPDAGAEELATINLPPVSKFRLPAAFQRRAGFLFRGLTGREGWLENRREAAVEEILDRLESMMEKENDPE
jgi:hypothetical protein